MAAAFIGVYVLIATAGSFVFNLATDGAAGRPHGLRFVRAGGFDTRYRTWGTAGSPIVLVPGAFETADTFSALGTVLGEHHRVFAIDLTGTGYSTPSPPFDAYHLASQLLAFLRAMGLTGANAPVLVGHSSGAAVVGMAVLRERLAARGIVFLDGDATPLTFPAIAGRLLINPYRTSLVRLALGSGWLIQRIYQSACGPTCPPLTANGLRTWRLPLEQSSFLDVTAYNLRHGIPSMTGAQLRALRALQVPKLVIYGRNDPELSRLDADAAATRIGAPPPVAIPGRHLTMISSPRQLAAVLDRFSCSPPPCGFVGWRAETKGSPQMQSESVQSESVQSESVQSESARRRSDRKAYPAGVRRRFSASLAGLAVAAAIGVPAWADQAAGAVRASASVTPMTDISSGCAGQNAEVEEASAAPQYVYATWIGCNGIGFARSTDGGRHFGPPVTVPGSIGKSWDPAIAVAPSGTVYIAYMYANGPGPSQQMYPVVAASFDHGATFPQVSAVRPRITGNWGDRDFIAVGKTGTVYLTWDYGPSAAEVKLLCSPTGSCAYSNGDFNAVIQKSTDGGKKWGPIRHVEPGFPLGGGYGAPLVVQPNGRVDVLYIGHPTSPRTLAVHPGYEFFTSSANGTTWPAHPLKLWPSKGTLSLPEWWIDGDLSADAGGNLYATWDTQTSHGDIGWLTFSTNHGRTWSRPVRVTPDTDKAPHIVQSAGGSAGIAYIAWQTSAPKAGWATYLRPFSIKKGWLGPAIRVSARYGNRTIWPGDTFGITVLPGRGTRLALTWGSAVGRSGNSEIWASDVTLP